MAKIQNIKGDATAPVSGYDYVVIMHCCNDINRWGKGFVVPLGEKYPEAKKSFLLDRNPPLGKVSFIRSDNVIIANIIGQHKIWKIDGVPPIRYEALEEGFKHVQRAVSKIQASGKTVAVQFPLIGCGLAGGTWDVVSNLIESNITTTDLFLFTL